MKLSPFAHRQRLIMWCGVITALALGAALLLQPPPSAPHRSAPQTQRVESVSNGKSFVLEGGQVVRLASIQAPNFPDPPTEKRPRPGEPLAEESRAALAALIDKKSVRLEPVRDGTDKRGRIIAQVYGADGQWIQGAMVGSGWAMVYSFPGQADYANKMLPLERAARAEKRGLWAHDYYAPIAAANAPRYRGKFKLVEETIMTAGQEGEDNVLYFSADKTGLALTVEPRDRGHFSALNLESLVGKNIRVRGWIRGKTAPRMALTHPEQVEILP